METLGHSQVSLTLNTYSDVLPALQEEAAKRMDSGTVSQVMRRIAVIVISRLYPEVSRAGLGT